MNRKKNFLGTGWGFPPEFDDDLKGVKMVSDAEDIVESLNILLRTRPGERIMVPDYGCNLQNFVFQNIDVTNITLMKDMIATSILKYEARIELIDIIINSDNYLDGMITIEIEYVIRATNSRNNIVFPYYIKEGTLLTTL